MPYHQDIHLAEFEHYMFTAELVPCLDEANLEFQAFIAAYVASASDPDTLTYDEAMRAPDADEFKNCWHRRRLTTSSNMAPGIVVPKSEAIGHRILPGTWTFKRKRTPSGELKKYQSRWCCRGDLEDTTGQENSSPVVEPSSVRLLLYMTIFFGLKTKCIDFLQAFIQADLPEDHPVFMHYPRGYPLGPPDHCLKLKKSLYGLSAAPKLFYEHTKDNLRQTWNALQPT